MSNQSEKRNYNPNLVLTNEISKIYLCENLVSEMRPKSLENYGSIILRGLRGWRGWGFK